MPNRQSPHAISFYFVLYLVAIVTVFVITMERDTLLRRRDEDIAHLVEIYVKPLRLAPAIDTARFFFPPQPDGDFRTRETDCEKRRAN